MKSALSLSVVFVMSLFLQAGIVFALDTAPILTLVTPVPNPTYNTTPQFVFNSNEAGIITYVGDCKSSTIFNAVPGANTITFDKLDIGWHSNCIIMVTDLDGVAHTTSLPVPPFEVKQFPSPIVPIPKTPEIIDIFPPTLAMVTPISTPSTNTTPTFTFLSSEAGTITYNGDCSSTDTSADKDNNTITLNTLSPGTYTNCRLNVTDSSSNVSSWLNIPAFTITTATVNNTCAGYSDVLKTDSSCDAIVYVKSIGAMTGNPNGTFAPNEYLQRDQVAKISLETFDLFVSSKNYCSGNPFPDVTSAAWAYQYICRGVSLGLITGYASGADAGYYRPARSVNRVEFLALMLRNVDGAMPSIYSTSYSDVSSGQWFSGFAKFSYDNSLFTGSTLYPARLVKRVEVAEIIYKLHKLGHI
jgi:hypothetical protein